MLVHDIVHPVFPLALLFAERTTTLTWPNRFLNKDVKDVALAWPAAEDIETKYETLSKM